MNLSEAQRALLKERQLRLLEEFISFCTAHDLDYWMIGGSLLGARRHHGMIPWDDDIDVCMPRKDYDRLISLADQLGENRFLQCTETEPESGMLFAKLMDTGTVYIEASRKNRNIHHCVFIDIFPLDDYPDGFLHQEWRNLKDLAVKLRLRCLYSKEHYRGNRFRRTLACAACAIAAVLFPDVREMCVRHEEYLRKPICSGHVYLSAGAYGRKDIYRRGWFAGTLSVPFEHLVVRIPTGYDALLKQVYGDYMKYPDIRERKGHHEAAAFRISE